MAVLATPFALCALASIGATERAAISARLASTALADLLHARHAKQGRSATLDLHPAQTAQRVHTRSLNRTRATTALLAPGLPMAHPAVKAALKERFLELGPRLAKTARRGSTRTRKQATFAGRALPETTALQGVSIARGAASLEPTASLAVQSVSSVEKGRLPKRVQAPVSSAVQAPTALPAQEAVVSALLVNTLGPEPPHVLTVNLVSTLPMHQACALFVLGV